MKFRNFTSKSMSHHFLLAKSLIHTRRLSLSVCLSIPISKKDDLIKQRTQQKRKERKESLTQKSVGASRAKRDAKTAARRGLRSSAKANKMEVDKEVSRQVSRNTGGGPKKTLAQAGGLKVRRSTRVRVSNKNTANGGATGRGGGNAARRNAKSRSERVKANQQKGNQKVKPPSKRAVNAALRAINNSGFKTPKGMKMVISFTPESATKENKAGGGNKNKNPKKTGGKNKNQRGNNRGGR